MPLDASVPVRALRIAADGTRVGADLDLVQEEPLEVRVRGPEGPPVTVGTTLRTPGHEEDLAVGWLVAEGIADPDDVVDITVGDPHALARPENEITVHLAGTVDRGRVVARHTVVTASCGLCGRATLEDLVRRFDDAPPPAATAFAWTVVAGLPDRLRAAQGLFAVTGAVHAAGVFDRTGTPLVVREDVGRHNALDKAVGALARSGRLPLHEHAIALSGRIGLDLVVKARAAGAGLVVAVGAPTSLAVAAAEHLGLTLVGFAREGAGTVYTHPGRIADRGPTVPTTTPRSAAPAARDVAGAR